MHVLTLHRRAIKVSRRDAEERQSRAALARQESADDAQHDSSHIAATVDGADVERLATGQYFSAVNRYKPVNVRHQKPPVFEPQMTAKVSVRRLVRPPLPLLQCLVSSKCRVLAGSFHSMFTPCLRDISPEELAEVL